MDNSATSPNHDPRLVEHLLLEEIVDLHPARLTVADWVVRIANDPLDGGEVEVIELAIREMRRFGLVRYRNDDLVVEPAQATLRIFALLADGPISQDLRL